MTVERDTASGINNQSFNVERMGGCGGLNCIRGLGSLEFKYFWKVGRMSDNVVLYKAV